MRIIFKMPNSRIAYRAQYASDNFCRVAVIEAKRILLCTESSQLEITDIASTLGFENPTINLFRGRAQDRSSAPHPSPAIVGAFFTQSFRSCEPFSTFSFVSSILEWVLLAPSNISLFLT